MNFKYLSLAEHFSLTPDGSKPAQVPLFAEDFYESIVAPLYTKAQRRDSDLILDFDGTKDVARSFLEDLCIRLVSDYGPDDLADRLVIISQEQPHIEDQISLYIAKLAEIHSSVISDPG